MSSTLTPAFTADDTPAPRVAESDPKAVMVLGAAGFIGCALSQTLAAQGLRVVAGTRRAWDFGHEGIQNAVAPFNDASHFLPWLEQVDAVVHAASHTTPGSSAAHPQLDGNLRTTLALLEALQAVPRRLLYLSSGGALYEERMEGTVNEDTPLNPRSYHGAGKIAAESFIHAWSVQSGGRACILRPSNVYGPGQHPRQGFGIIPTAFECLQSGQPLSIWGDGLNVRDYLYIDDLNTLCLKVLRAPQAQAGVQVFNASWGQGHTLHELLAFVERVTGRQLQREYQSPRAIDMRRIVPDNRRARASFDWQPQVDLPTGLALSWQWFQRHYPA